MDSCRLLSRLGKSRKTYKRQLAKLSSIHPCYPGPKSKTESCGIREIRGVDRPSWHPGMRFCMVARLVCSHPFWRHQGAIPCTAISGSFTRGLDALRFGMPAVLRLEGAVNIVCSMRRCAGVCSVA